MRLKQIDGLPIIDAKRPIRLIVTDKDVRDADPKKPHSCAVALACERHLHAKEVRVHLGRVYVRTNDLNWQRYETPAPMRQEIITFDRGGRFIPQEFILPPPAVRATGKRQGGPFHGKRGKKAKQKPHRIVKDVRLGPA